MTLSSRIAARIAARYRRDAVWRLIAKFKEKKPNPNKGGKPIYLYSEGQVKVRNKDKAERLEKLSRNIHKLRARVKKDLVSDNTETRLVALAIGLMDHTAERVGSEESAKGNLNEDGEKHFGVSTWKRDHVTFKGDSATISYTGKSGVKQKKTVSDKTLLKALRRAYDDCKSGDLFCHDDVRVTPNKINQYLSEFDITAKDIRGLNANSMMREALSSARSKGGKLPEDKKEREKQLRIEFKEALEQTAERLGHEPSTLASNYLTPGLEDQFKNDGTVMTKMKASVGV